MLFPLSDTASWQGKGRPDFSTLTGLPFIGVTPSGVLACTSRPEHALPPEGQQLPQPVAGPSIRVSSCHALRVWCALRWWFPSKLRWKMTGGTEAHVLSGRKTWAISPLSKTRPCSLTAFRIWSRLCSLARKALRTWPGLPLPQGPCHGLSHQHCIVCLHFTFA